MKRGGTYHLIFGRLTLLVHYIAWPPGPAGVFHPVGRCRRRAPPLFPLTPDPTGRLPFALKTSSQQVRPISIHCICSLWRDPSARAREVARAAEPRIRRRGGNPHRFPQQAAAPHRLPQQAAASRRLAQQAVALQAALPRTGSAGRISCSRFKSKNLFCVWQLAPPLLVAVGG